MLHDSPAELFGWGTEQGNYHGKVPLLGSVRVKGEGKTHCHTLIVILSDFTNILK